jgi:hypothetical protein
MPALKVSDVELNTKVFVFANEVERSEHLYDFDWYHHFEAG